MESGLGAEASCQLASSIGARLRARVSAGETERLSRRSGAQSSLPCVPKATAGLEE